MLVLFCSKPDEASLVISFVLKVGQVVGRGFRCDLESVSEEEDGRKEPRRVA